MHSRATHVSRRHARTGGRRKAVAACQQGHAIKQRRPGAHRLRSEVIKPNCVGIVPLNELMSSPLHAAHARPSDARQSSTRAHGQQTHGRRSRRGASHQTQRRTSAHMVLTEVIKPNCEGIVPLKNPKARSLHHVHVHAQVSHEHQLWTHAQLPPPTGPNHQATPAKRASGEACTHMLVRVLLGHSSMPCHTTAHGSPHKHDMLRAKLFIHTTPPPPTRVA